MHMRLIAVFVICLGGLVFDWIECRAIANVQLNGRQLKFHNDDDSITKQLTLDDSATNLSSKNMRAGRHRSTRESATQSTSTDYELAFKNASAGTVLPDALIRKIVSILGKKAAPAPPATSSGTPNKQLFGGRLPPFIERIIQRIQNYFSVYNSQEYFDSNRPPPSSSSAQHSAITLICSNTTSGSVSCSEPNSSEEQEEEEDAPGETLEICDGGGGQEENSADVGSPQDEYNVVVTHTIVQDSSLNVYSPPAPSPVPFIEANAAATSNADSTHMFSNVVVILEPAAGQYSPPPLDNPDKKKFYVYVNPTAANKNQQTPPQRLKTWNESVGDGADKSSNQPFANTTYTVIIRGDKLEEYNNDLQTADNNSLNPEIAIYVRNSTTKKLKKCKLPLQPEDCDQTAATSVSLVSRSVSDASEENDSDIAKATKTSDNENPNKVPNINLMLVPPKDQHQSSKSNKSCASKNKVTKNPQLEYYVLKPDNGSLNKGKTGGNDEEKATFYLHKTSIGAETLSQTYLPPPPPSSSTTKSSLSNDRPQNSGEGDAELEVTSSEIVNAD